MARRWWTLAAVCTGVFMLLLDITIVNVALPDIERGFHASLSDLQWVIDAYALTLAAFLLTAGSLADLSGGGSRSPSESRSSRSGRSPAGSRPAPVPVIARAARASAGDHVRTALALLPSSFHGKHRGVAFGAFGAVTASCAVGPVLGGALQPVEAFGSELYQLAAPVGWVGHAPDKSGGREPVDRSRHSARAEVALRAQLTDRE